MTVSASRRRFLQWTAAAGAVAALPWPRPVRAAAPFTNGIVIDGLGGPGGRNNTPDQPLNEAELADVRASGLTAFHFTIGAVGTMPPLEAFEKIVREVARWERQIENHPDALARVRDVEDIRAAKAAGRTGLIYGLQDGVAFEDDPARLDALHYAGVRVVQPTYNRRNLLGDGCMEPSDAGLSRTGHEAVERIQELGMLLDLSHCGRRTTADALALAKRPPAFTHTGCDALVEHPRHRTDAELRAVAELGGVNGIYVMPYLAKGAQPTASDVITHIEHAIDVAGEDHVGIGTDGRVSPVELTDAYRDRFRKMVSRRREQGIAAPHETEEGYLFAADLNTPDRFRTLAERLLERGHGEARVEKILGGNLLRVFGEAWS